jgi:paraquat-inducible protein A
VLDAARLEAATRGTLAGRAKGWAMLIGPLLAVTLLILPITWWMPLFRTELLVFLENDVTILGAVQSLADIDLFLCAIVILFGMMVPVVKLMASLYVWFVLAPDPARRWIGYLGKVSKFSMLDVFLIAVTIVGLKGVGLGKVEVEYGLYAFAGVVLAILLLSFWMLAAAERLCIDAVDRSTP